LQIPLVGISSLEVLAYNGRYFPGVVSPLFDARRGQVYTGLYRFEQGAIQTVKEDQIIDATNWANELKRRNEPVLFLGNDIEKHRDTFETILHELANFGELSQLNPRPGELAIAGMKRDPEVQVHHFTPNYVQLAEAEKKWLTAQKMELTNEGTD
jgi:tRNA threonylcarbamoyladenosine biosynthesis protein TsaB